MPASEIVRGDMVLTHTARFQRVLDVLPQAVTEKECYLGIGSTLLLDPRSWIQERDGFSRIDGRAGFMAKCVTQLEWTLVSQQMEQRGMQRPRGSIIETSPGSMILGLSPARLFGEILFATRLEGSEHVMFDKVAFSGRLYEVLVDVDGSYVAERLCVRGGIP